MRSYLHLLLRALLPAAVVAVLAGVFLGWPFAAAGFPLLTADAIRRVLLETLAGTALFLALYALLRGLAGRFSGAVPAWLQTALPASLAAVPFVALAGYRLNRARAIRPSEILEPWALVPNLVLLGVCALALAVTVYFLHLWRDRKAPSPWPAAAAATLLSILQIGLPLAWQQERKEAGPDVVVILVDALRADHVGAYGYPRATTPAIDRLAEDGVLFRQTISSSTFTKSSIASLFTGRYPYRHGVYWGSRRLPGGGFEADLLHPAEVTLAEAFRAAGHLTAAWVQNSHLRAMMGFDQGFIDYNDQQGGIERIHRHVFPWLEGPARRYSFFAYLHYIDLHDPYLPAPPYDTLFGPHEGHPVDVYEGIDLARWGAYLEAVRQGEVTLSEDDVERLKALYDGQLRAIDDGIGRLLDQLKREGLYENALIVVTSDHGDGFMEHGFISHSTAPYEELVRVPLIVKWPGNRFAGQIVDEQTRLVDLLPTLVSAAGVSFPDSLEIDGCDLAPLVEAGARPPGESADCGRAVIEIAEDDGPPTLAVRTERFKVIYRAGRPARVYDLVKDHGETRDLAAAELDDVDAALLAEALPLVELAERLVSERMANPADRLELDEKTVKELKALGYVAD